MKKNQISNKKKQVRKPISQNFAPKRLAISYQPPMIIMQYLVIDTGKLYHHKMRLDSILKKSNVTKQDVLNYIKTKHHLYFLSGKVKDPQILKFIDKILIKLGKSSKTINNGLNCNKQEAIGLQDDDFDYLNDDQEYQQDYEDYQQQPVKEKQKKVQVKDLIKNKNTFLTYCQEYGNQEEQHGQASWDLDMDQNADFV